MGTFDPIFLKYLIANELLHTDRTRKKIIFLRLLRELCRKNCADAAALYRVSRTKLKLQLFFSAQDNPPQQYAGSCGQSQGAAHVRLSGNEALSQAAVHRRRTTSPILSHSSPHTFYKIHKPIINYIPNHYLKAITTPLINYSGKVIGVVQFFYFHDDRQKTPNLSTETRNLLPDFATMFQKADEETADALPLSFLKHCGWGLSRGLIEHQHQVASAASFLYKLWLCNFGLDEKQGRVYGCGILLAALLHDIGKTKINPAVLHKKERLTAAERVEIEQHAAIGAQMLGEQPSKLGKMICNTVLHHHQQWDGLGYPHGRLTNAGERIRPQGQQLSLAVRILTIADAYLAMRTKRCYRDALSAQAAQDEMVRQSGKQFDPDLMHLFLPFLTKLDKTF